MARQSEQLEREAEQTRRQLAEWLEELRSRVTPGQVIDQLADFAREGAAADFLRNLGREIRENPIPVLLIAVGIGWLVIAASRRHGLGGIAVGVVRKGEPPVVECAGWADHTGRRRVDTDTAFRSLVGRVGLEPRSARSRPCLKSLRHSFAVSTLISWYRDGKDVNARLPLLSTWLGQSIRADVDPLNNTNFQTDHIFGVWISQDLDDPARYAPYLLQGGLGMPDRDYYLDASPRMDKIRTAYRDYIVTMLKLAGVDGPDAKAVRVLALERRIAAAHWTRTASARDASGAPTFLRLVTGRLLQQWDTIDTLFERVKR